MFSMLYSSINKFSELVIQPLQAKQSSNFIYAFLFLDYLIRSGSSTSSFKFFFKSLSSVITMHSSEGLMKSFKSRSLTVPENIL